MDNSFDASLEFTLAEEGGYIDHPTDPRLATNHGITLARLRRFLRDPGLGTGRRPAHALRHRPGVVSDGFLESHALRRACRRAST